MDIRWVKTGFYISSPRSILLFLPGLLIGLKVARLDLLDDVRLR